MKSVIHRCVKTRKNSHKGTDPILVCSFKKCETFKYTLRIIVGETDKVRWVERSAEVGVVVPVSVCLLQNVTGKIGKAFNVMQCLSNHAI